MDDCSPYWRNALHGAAARRSLKKHCFLSLWPGREYSGAAKKDIAGPPPLWARCPFIICAANAFAKAGLSVWGGQPAGGAMIRERRRLASFGYAANGFGIKEVSVSPQYIYIFSDTEVVHGYVMLIKELRLAQKYFAGSIILIRPACESGPCLRRYSRTMLFRYGQRDHSQQKSQQVRCLLRPAHASCQMPPHTSRQPPRSSKSALFRSERLRRLLPILSLRTPMRSSHSKLSRSEHLNRLPLSTPLRRSNMASSQSWNLSQLMSFTPISHIYSVTWQSACR